MTKPFRDTKVYDILVVSPLIVFYLFAAVGIMIRVSPELGKLAKTFDWPPAVDALSQILAMVFLLVQVVLFLLRRLPSARATSILPNVLAVIGANSAALFLLLPRAHDARVLPLLSTGLISLGTLGAIAVVWWLRDAFAILPQARALVTSGPYSYVRHPLYLFEIIATVGVSLQYVQPAGALVLALVIALQFTRMHYEEGVLSRALPEYATYRTRTARIIPGIY